MATRMLQRRGTAAEWAAQNPILAEGEIGFETDTKIIKIGDGETEWNELSLSPLTASGTVMTGALVVLEPTEPNHAARFQDLNSLVSKTGDTMTGALTMNEQPVIRPELLGYQENEVSSSTATMTIDFLIAQLHITTRTGALTVAWSNLPTAGKVRVASLIIPSTVTEITWPGGTKFAGGAAPKLDEETWISVVARGTVVTVGAAWAGVV